MKEYGIKYGYPIARRFLSKIPDYVALSRPYTAFSAFLVGYLIALKLWGFMTWKPLLIGMTLGFGQAFGQVVNQITDVDIDKINKPYRPIPSGRITIRSAWKYALTLLELSIFASLLVSETFMILNLVLLFFACFYSLKPIRAKDKIWSILWMATSRGLLPPIIISYTRYHMFERYLSYLGVLAFIWVLSYQVTKDIGDVEGDRAYGVKTIPVLYGLTGTAIYMSVMTVILMLYVSTAVFFGGLGTLNILMPILGLGVLSSTKLETLTENNLGWSLFYAGLALIYFFYFVS